jgi:hypothetical protein
MKQKMQFQEIGAPPHLSHCKAYTVNNCTIFVGKEPTTVRGVARWLWHLSIAHPRRYPSWDEIKAARYEFVPDEVTMAMLLPPKSEYVNLHSNCFHLHEIDGDGA